MSLSQNKNKSHFTFLTPNELEFAAICSVFDSFDNFLGSDSMTKYGMLYIKSGNPVIFDDDTKSTYLNAMKSEKDFNEFIEYMEQQFNDALNMDW